MEVFLFTDSAISQDLIKAYLETEYRVLGELPFIIRVGLESSELLEAHKQHQVTCSAFVTAWNPYSQQVDDAKNRKMQAALANELTNRELHFIEGIGQHPSGNWGGEESYLILGLTLEAARVLGATLEQNAILWSGMDGTPQLILLR
jgi:hypothetical protein